jgi:MoxR-like ATPase
LFTGLLLADEINRTPPKTQSALLEAMQERQVTVEGQTFPLAAPFHVLATANPVEYEGTYPLPEAQLDRFLMRVSFGYPSAEDEWEVLQRRMARRQEEQTLTPVTDAAGLLAMQAAIESVVIDPSVGRYCVALSSATRSHPHVLVGASPRGALALMLTARSYAVLAHRDYVTPEDVKAVAEAVLAHRITVKPELWMSNVSGATVVASTLASVRTPGAREPLASASVGDRARTALRGADSVETHCGAAAQPHRRHGTDVGRVGVRPTRPLGARRSAGRHCPVVVDNPTLGRPGARDISRPSEPARG